MEVVFTPQVPEVKNDAVLTSKLAVDFTEKLKNMVVMHENPTFESTLDVSLITIGKFKNMGRTSNSSDDVLVLDAAEDRKKKAFRGSGVPSYRYGY
ncbi:hypothetical protein PTKIN_Ptkin10aG0067700 [Pterospermum kingtungense]